MVPLLPNEYWACNDYFHFTTRDTRMLSQKVEVSQHLVGGNVGSSRALGSRKMRVGIVLLLVFILLVILSDCLTVIDTVGSPTPC